MVWTEAIEELLVNEVRNARESIGTEFYQELFSASLDQ